MALTKIFTGMELGPEAIDANFKEVTDNIKSVEIKDTGWIDLPIQASGWSGWIKVRKRGPEIRLNGELHPSGNEANGLVLATLPAGFTTLAWVVSPAVNNYGSSFAISINGSNQLELAHINGEDHSFVRLNGSSFWE